MILTTLELDVSGDHTALALTVSNSTVGAPSHGVASASNTGTFTRLDEWGTAISVTENGVTVGDASVYSSQLWANASLGTGHHTLSVVATGIVPPRPVSDITSRRLGAESTLDLTLRCCARVFLRAIRYRISGGRTPRTKDAPPCVRVLLKRILINKFCRPTRFVVQSNNPSADSYYRHSIFALSRSGSR